LLAWVEVTHVDLRTLKLRSGEQFSDVRDVELEPFELGGQRYLPVPERPSAAYRITQATSGLLFELELGARLFGPCVRCLTEASVSADVDAREYQAANPEASDELLTPYVVDSRLDLSAWARDAIALALPDKILCRPDCAGLCAICGADLNVEPHDHGEPEPDLRWSKLAELKDRL
jgi:uncharacterized protein